MVQSGESQWRIEAMLVHWGPPLIKTGDKERRERQCEPVACIDTASRVTWATTMQ